MTKRYGGLQGGPSGSPLGACVPCSVPVSSVKMPPGPQGDWQQEEGVRADVEETLSAHTCYPRKQHQGAEQGAEQEAGGRKAEPSPALGPLRRHVVRFPAASGRAVSVGDGAGLTSVTSLRAFRDSTLPQVP